MQGRPCSGFDLKSADRQLNAQSQKQPFSARSQRWLSPPDYSAKLKSAREPDIPKIGSLLTLQKFAQSYDVGSATVPRLADER